MTRAEIEKYIKKKYKIDSVSLWADYLNFIVFRNNNVKKMCKGADVDMKGLAIQGSQAKNSKQRVADWL